MSPNGPAHGDLIRVDEVTKAYPDVLANDRISLALQPGQVHAVVGENGAGKSTLLGTLYGLHRPDSGRILIGGEEVHFAGPRDALAAGVAFVQQTFSLIPTLSVAENLLLASHGAGAPLSRRESHERVVALAEHHGLDVHPERVIDDLTVGERQQAELVKALAFSPRILLLDEPTSVLTPQQVAQLSVVMRRLAGEGIGIILVTHKLEAVLADADHVTVLRGGRVVGSMPAADASSEVLARLMIGELPQRQATLVATGPGRPGAAVMVAEGVSVRSRRGDFALEDVSLEVRAGEILGIAGVEGGGQVELTEALAGVREVESGTVRLGSEPMPCGQVRAFQAAGVGHIPADRRGDGVVEELSVADNLLLPIADRKPFSRFGILRRGAVRRHAEELIAAYDVRVPGPEVRVGALSGGNQQKVVVARECSRGPRVTVCCYPTQGLDFAAAEFVWGQLRDLRAAGAAVVLASSDLDELLELSDRILVLHAGRIVGEAVATAVTSEQVGLMMGGVEAR